MPLVDEELTGEIKRCFFDVHNQVGLGLPEDAYQKGLIAAFTARRIPFRSKPEVTLAYRGQKSVSFFPDFIVADRVVLELKAQREEFARENYIQLFSYLKATDIRLGFLVNFGLGRVHDDRILFDSKPPVIHEDWDAIKGAIDGEDKKQMTDVREILLEIGQQFGLGYGEATYQKLVQTALRMRPLPYQLKPKVHPLFNSREIGLFELECLCVSSRLVCLITALRDGIDLYDIERARSYLKNLRQHFGVVANFGKERMELRGVRVQ